MPTFSASCFLPSRAEDSVGFLCSVQFRLAVRNNMSVDGLYPSLPAERGFGVIHRLRRVPSWFIGTMYTITKQILKAFTQRTVYKNSTRTETSTVVYIARFAYTFRNKYKVSCNSFLEDTRIRRSRYAIMSGKTK